jgi:hypothetical protein
VPPGTYTVRLRAGGVERTAPLVVRMDPRVKTPPAGLQLQYTTSRAINAALTRLSAALAAARTESGAGSAATTALARLQGQATQLLGLVDGADLPPTPQMLAAWTEVSTAIDAALAAERRQP